MKENEQLLELYNSKWDVIKDALTGFNDEVEEGGDSDNMVTNPLLIQIDEKYANAELKIMFFGQETNWWGPAFNGEIEPIIQIYKGFFLKDEYKKYGKPFWNGIDLMKDINKKNINKSIGYVWNNLVKIGRCSEGFPELSHKFTVKSFNVIRDEIRILKPDILIFLSGPNYDSLIAESLGDYTESEIDNFKTRQLCELIFKEDLGIKKALRTYHPRYLRMSKTTDEYFNVIGNEIKCL